MWNTIGGYRFWLFDKYGNAFYHAHLSAFAPLAQDGARVHQGDVIGFVGHTGDAQGTPDHLHFEVVKYERDPRDNAESKRAIARMIEFIHENKERRR